MANDQREHGRQPVLEVPSGEVGEGSAILDRKKTVTMEKDKLRKVFSMRQPDSISPLMLGKSKYVEDFSLDRTPKQHSAKLGKRLSGRLVTPELKPSRTAAEEIAQIESIEEAEPAQSQHHTMSTMVNEIAAWIHAEKERHNVRKARRKATSQARKAERSRERARDSSTRRDRSDSTDSSKSSTAGALQRLESIVKTNSSSRYLDKAHNRKTSLSIRKHGSFRKLRRQSTVGSDTELELDQLVPSCEVVLDNTKTVMYTDNTSTSSLDLVANRSATRDKHAWLTFKYEILRLTHTLKFQGWRQVPLEDSSDIDVERISGCLTNAVYVVSPPSNLPLRSMEESNGTQSVVPRKSPEKLLLRIYGPQVGHLIDREAELHILRRLSRQRIGPRLLGTFLNGRFEQYFHARALKPEDLRNPDTSKQIAMRMRELHDGIELEEEERDKGPFVWRNWDKWVDRCEKLVTFMDQQVMHGQQKPSAASSAKSSQHGLVCGTDWAFFKKTVERYRERLNAEYGGRHNIRDQLVFAHNDTQYGNILRAESSGETPLQLPANKHKQLIVIDFEYASANLIGQEFANHFTEWCYNYHDPKYSFACNTTGYPTPEEQYRFVRAYVLHQPEYAPAACTPRFLPQDNLVTSPAPFSSPSQSSTSKNILRGKTSNFSFTRHPNASENDQELRDGVNSSYFPSPSSVMLEQAEATPSATFPSLDSSDEDAGTAAKVATLLREARLWRTANHTQWVAWGVVQAKVPGFVDNDNDRDSPSNKTNDIQSAQLHEVQARVDLTEGTDPLSNEAKSNAQDLKERRPESHFGEGNRLDDMGVTEDGESHAEEEAEEDFDYLRYSRDRAMFFWGDCLQLGIVTEAELEPWGFLEDVKIVPY